MSTPASSAPPGASRAPTVFDRLLQITDAPMLVGILTALLAWVLTHSVERLQETATIEFSISRADPLELALCGFPANEGDSVRTVQLHNLSRRSTIGGVNIEMVARGSNGAGNVLITRPLCLIDVESTHTSTDAIDAHGNDTKPAERRSLALHSTPPGARSRVLVATSGRNPLIKPRLRAPCGNHAANCAALNVTMVESGGWTWLVRHELGIVLTLGLLAAAALGVATARIARAH